MYFKDKIHPSLKKQFTFIMISKNFNDLSTVSRPTSFLGKTILHCLIVTSEI